MLDYVCHDFKVNFHVIAGYYGATTPADVSWQASPLQVVGNADTTHQIEVAHQLQLAHVA